MSSAETVYSARIEGPQYLERARTQTVKLPLYRENALIAPASGTFTLLNESGDEVISAQVVTITNSVATASVSASDIPATVSFSENWRERWALVIGGVTRTFERDAVIVRNVLYTTNAAASPGRCGFCLCRRQPDARSIRAKANMCLAVGVPAK